MVDKDAVDHCLTTKVHRAHIEDEKEMDQISWVVRTNRPPGNRLQTSRAGYREEEGESREKKLVDGYKPSVVEAAPGSQELEEGVVEEEETLAQAVEPKLVAKP